MGVNKDVSDHAIRLKYICVSYVMTHKSEVFA